MKLKYFGHSAFQITTSDGTIILIDPFITGNPFAKTKAKDLKADFIILSHAHGDHLGDTHQIATKDTTIICVAELSDILNEQGFSTHPLQIGGGYDFPFGRVDFTTATHGSRTPEGEYAGLAAGIILSADGTTIHHAGDTGLFSDMKLIGERNKIDYYLVPIGGNYTMDIADAALAASWIRPRYAIPMHYNTFPIIKKEPLDFVKEALKYQVEVRVMDFEEEISL